MKFYFYAKLTLTGAIILGLELVASRILTPFFGVSLNVWSSILAITLIALALGYKFGGYLSNRLQFSGLVAFFVGSGAVASAWLNLSFLSYPVLLRSLSDWGLVAGSIAACVYLIFVPLLLFSSLNSVLVAILGNSKYDDTGNEDHNSGTVFFTSTVGSVIGVFFVTYYLLPNFSNHMVYGLLALAAALSTVFLTFACADITRSQKIVLCGGGLAMALVSVNFIADDRWKFDSPGFRLSGPVATWTVLAKEPSFYGNHAVVEYEDVAGRKWKALLTGGLVNNQVYPSGVSAQNHSHVVEAMVFSDTETPENALILGLGVGVVPTILSDRGIRVDVVELDPKVAEIAREYFDFDDSRVNLVLEDARTFVRTCQKQYDVVVVDVAQGDGIPPHIVSFEFHEDIKKCLSEGGAVVVNAFYGTPESGSKQSLFKTLTSVYGSIVVFEMPVEELDDSTWQQGFILARNTNGAWSFDMKLGSLPKRIHEDLVTIFGNWKQYTQDNEFLRGAATIHDDQNDWRRQTLDADVAYRKQVTSKIPWQILLD